ncbi:hypothetical protein M0802_010461 [Mischocyttarus mexicanus]|nr:hypothetical protein M0802_010461 [Mischocyttarus mexicanus]
MRIYYTFVIILNVRGDSVTLRILERNNENGLINGALVLVDNTKRDSRNIKPNILSPQISTKKEPIYLSNYHNYRGKNYLKNHNSNNNNDNNNIVIENRSLDSSRKTSYVVHKNDKENLIEKYPDEDKRLNNFTLTKEQQQQQQQQREGILHTLLAFKKTDDNLSKRKIPRPANAFMLFANEWRKKLASENPRESNKDISVRLGILWKNISKEVKEKYFTLAREVDAEHKKKYPGTCFILFRYFN